jgi:hypothetical protein
LRTVPYRTFETVRARAGSALAALLLILLLYSNTGAVESFDFEQPILVDWGYPVKDHSLVYRNGVYHIFYIRGDETSFGHASSPDLKHWTFHDTVLYTGPEEWDERMIWAPCIVDARSELGYELMYYTGVNMPVAQRVCLALGTSIDSWFKAPVELYAPFHGDTSWTAWSEDTWSNYRDPHFFEDGGYQYLINTAWTKNELGTIALARSEDYFNWTDAGPLYVHNSWHVLESANLFKRDGKYHLFFTEETIGGVSYMSSDSLTSGWDISNRAILDNGAAAEFLQVTPNKYLISRHSGYVAPSGEKISTIKIDTLTFYENYVRVDFTKYLANDWTILYGYAFMRQPIFGDNPSYRGEEPGSIGFEGNWWIGTYECFNGPLSGTWPGAQQGDEATGAIRSRDFYITGDLIRLLVGGGRKRSSCYVALCDAETDWIFFRETGEDTDLMSERIWDVSKYKGRRVYLKIVDDSTEPFGHINVDGIEERLKKKDENRGGKDLIRDPYIYTETLLSIADRGDSEYSISNHPNPFNPSTGIAFTAAPGAHLSLVIYDVSGREIDRIEAKAGPDGRGLARWDGSDRQGEPVSSGVYLCVMKDGGRILSSCKLVLGR